MTDVEGLVSTAITDALRLSNRSRPADQQLSSEREAVLFGAGSSLDSLGLVALVIDIEDALRDHGLNLDLTSAQAMSPTKSPFRTVASLIDHIVSQAADGR
jgi:acyl carrier protein